MTNLSLYFPLTAYVFIPSPSPHRRCTHLYISLIPTVYTHTLYSSPLFIYDYRCSIIIIMYMFIHSSLCVQHTVITVLCYLIITYVFITCSHPQAPHIPYTTSTCLYSAHSAFSHFSSPPRTWLSCFIYIMIHPLPLLMYLCIFL